MTSVCLVFHAHQPYHLRRYTFFDIGTSADYQNQALNQQQVQEQADMWYLPTNEMLLNLIQKTEGRFRVAFVLSGTLLQQWEQYRPLVIDSFKALAQTGQVEFVATPYYHSLASVHSRQEWVRQLKMHHKQLRGFFGQTPKVAANPGLLYSNAIGQFAAEMNYKGIISEGIEWYLKDSRADYLYHSKGNPLAVMLRNASLSDDLAVRFGNPHWPEHPLTTEHFIRKILKSNGQLINLSLPYEALGNWQQQEVPIFEFFQKLCLEIADHQQLNFVTPSLAIKRFEPLAEFDVPRTISWAEFERDLSAWRSNPLQKAALKRLYDMEPLVKKAKNEALYQAWGQLQSADIFRFMNTHGFNDGKYAHQPSPYRSPYDAYIYLMNAAADLELRLKEAKTKNTTRRKKA